MNGLLPQTAAEDGIASIHIAVSSSRKARDTTVVRIIKITDPDSGEVAEFEECQGCGGLGGYDASTDCEVYDDWQECEECDGQGIVAPGHFDKDRFISERDAFTPND